jgi:glucosamine--fructose-6-phosphate aminotransferase (isomerizing)
VSPVVDPSILRREIGEQPEVLARILERERPNVARLCAKWRRQNIQYITIAARGSSDNAATYAKYVFGALADMPVVLAAPSLHTLYDAGPKLKGSLVLAISQSGESPDILAVVNDAKEQGSPTLAITNSPSSTLAKTADEVILLHAGPEESIAATKTFTASIGAIALFAAAWVGGGDQLLDELLMMPARIAETIEVEVAARALAALLLDVSHCPVIGRGYNYATAFEIALKLKELTYVGAEPYSSADFLHGPIAMVDEKLHAIVVAPSGRTLDSSIEFLGRIRREGGRLVVISDRQELIDMADVGIRIPTAPEWLSPLTAVVPGQLVALHLARAKRLDVDKPRRLTKVTRTV